MKKYINSILCSLGYLFKGPARRLWFAHIYRWIPFCLLYLLNTNNIKYIKKYTPKKGDVVIDVGAFWGHFTIIASRLVGDSGKVISLEPEPSNYRNLLKIIRSHNLKNVVPVEKGLLEFSKKCVITEGNEGSTTIFCESVNVKTHIAEFISLDELVEEYNLKRVDFIKMDIEGNELEAIKGGEKTLQEYSPHLVIDAHIRNNEPTWCKLKPQLIKQGYICEVSESMHLILYAYKERT
ncbi:MAG: FkbM family methyltransferase [Nitrospirota bacterium]